MVEFAVKNKGELHEFSGGYTGWNMENEEPDDSYELMQYTGLKDKNGVEIYEGDIIRHNPYPYDSEPRFRKFEVENMEEFLKDVGFEERELGVSWEPQSVEVIGNIYQNPELTQNDND